MREFTAYEELRLERLEAETNKEELRIALNGCRAVLAGKRKHVFLRRANQSLDGIYDAGQLWELIVDRHTEEEMSVLAGARFTQDADIQRRADELVAEALDDLAAEHAEQSGIRAVKQELFEMMGVEA